jgi:hypothetical protein
MEKINSYSYVHVGLLVRYVSKFNTSDTKQRILDGLATLESALNKIGFNVSLKLTQHIVRRIEADTSTVQLTDKFESSFFPNFQTKITSLEDSIFAEATIKNVHLIPNRRFNPEYLLDRPEKLLKDTVFAKLSDIAKFDFSSACRCISYGEATASAFHILRCTEDTLKQFYYKNKKTNRLSKPMWGPMTSELRAKKSNKPSETILGALDVVRVSYRNPTQHPESRYDIESAQDLLGVCIDLINKMACEL